MRAWAISETYALRFLAALVVIVAIMVELGWWLKVPELVQVFPGQAPMQINTALCFLGLGIALLFAGFDRWRTAAPIACMVGGFALLTGLQYLFQADFGIDTLLGEPWTVDRTSHPGRMAPSTALCFIFSALALLLIPNQFRANHVRRVIALLCATKVSVAGSALLGYSSGQTFAFWWGQFTAMAVHTAALFLIVTLALGLLAKLNYRKPEPYLPRSDWAFLSAFALAMGFLVFWIAGRAKEYTYLVQITEQAEYAIATELESSFERDLLSILRLVRRLDRMNDSPVNQQAAMQRFINDYPAFSNIQLVDKSDRQLSPLQLQRPFNLETSTRSIHLAPAPLRSSLKQPFARLHIAFEGAWWERGIEMDVDLKSLFSTYLIGEVESHWYSVTSPLGVLYSSRAGKIRGDAQWERTSAFKLYDLELAILTVPTQATLDRVQSNDTWLTLLLGFGVSAATGILVFYEGRFRQRALDLEAANEQLKRSRAALDASPDDVFLIDVEQMRFIDVNQSALTNLGYSKDEFLAMGPHEIKPQFSREALQKALNKTLNQVDGRIETMHQRKNGETFIVDVLLRRVDADSPLLVAVARDISDKVAARQTLELTNIELQRSNSELQNFAQIASHDLREPLRKIMAFSESIVTDYRDTLDERGRDYLHRMNRAAERMNRLLLDMLDFARVTTKAKPFKQVSIEGIITDVVSDLETVIVESRGEITFGNLPEIEADETQMQQLFQNLIGNALKYRSPERPPKVTITANVSQAFVTYIVQDNGIGFDPQYKDRIFRMFERLHGRNAYEGTGIGLAICKKIVERHNGDIQVESEPGKGSRFSVSLPKSNPFKNNSRVPYIAASKSEQ